MIFVWSLTCIETINFDSFMTLIFQPFLPSFASLLCTAFTCHYRHYRRWFPFFKPVPFCSQRIRNLGLFWLFFLRIYALFGVVLQGGDVPKLTNIRLLCCYVVQKLQIWIMTKLLQSLHKVHIVGSVQLLCTGHLDSRLFSFSTHATHPGW